MALERQVGQNKGYMSVTSMKPFQDLKREINKMIKFVILKLTLTPWGKPQWSERQGTLKN